MTWIAQKAKIGCLVLAAWLFLMSVALWPFNFFAANKVSWGKKPNGMQFDWHGVAYAAIPDSITQNGLTLELWIKPASTAFRRYGGIVTLTGPDYKKYLSLGQSAKSLGVEMPPAGGQAKDQRFWVYAFSPGDDQLVTLTTSPQGTAVYLNGASAAVRPDVRSPAENASGQLIFGEAIVGHQPWTGDLLGVALYKRVLSSGEVKQHSQQWHRNQAKDLANVPGILNLYLLDEGSGLVAHNRAQPNSDLRIPKRFYLPPKAILGWPQDRAVNWKDDILNFAGFVPFGALLWIYFRVRCVSRRGSLLLAAFCGGATSLSIELLQHYLPSRVSSLPDLINNTAGAAAGAGIIYLVRLVFTSKVNTPR